MKLAEKHLKDCVVLTKLALLQKMRSKKDTCWKLCGPWYWRSESEQPATVWPAQ